MLAVTTLSDRTHLCSRSYANSDLCLQNLSEKPEVAEAMLKDGTFDKVMGMCVWVWAFMSIVIIISTN